MSEPGTVSESLPTGDGGPVAPSDAGGIGRLDAWLRLRWRWVAVLVLLFAVGVRGLAFAELQGSPVMHSHRYTQMDMKFFHEWAQRIVGGDVIGRQPFHPVHYWHQMVADEYFKSHPDVMRERFGIRLGDSVTAERRTELIKTLWDDWYGGTRFHQEPLYPYLLAGTYAIQGSPNVKLMAGLQSLSGLLIVALLLWMVRPLFGETAAVLAALMAAGWGPLIHYEAVLLRVSLICSGGVLVLLAVQRLWRSRADDEGELVATGGIGRLPRSAPRLILLGLILGLAVLLKSSFSVLAVGILGYRLWPHRRAWRACVRPLALVAAGAAICLVPVVIRNVSVGASPLSMTSVAAVTFAGGNVSGYDPTTGWMPYPHARAIAEVMDQSGGSLFGAFLVTVQGYDSIWDFVALQFGKIAKILHWYEEPNNTCYGFSELQSTTLAVVGSVFATVWILPAGLIGVVIALWQRRPVFDWLWLAFCSLLPMLIFYVLSRFRAPMMVALMPFAALTLTQLYGWMRSRRWLPLVGFGTALALLIAIVARDGDAEPVSAGNYRLAAMHYHVPRVKEFTRNNQLPEAIAEMERVLAVRPAFVDELGPKRPARTGTEMQVAMEFLTAYQMYASLLARSDGSAKLTATRKTIERLKDVEKVFRANAEAR